MRKITLATILFLLSLLAIPVFAQNTATLPTGDWSGSLVAINSQASAYGLTATIVPANNKQLLFVWEGTTTLQNFELTSVDNETITMPMKTRRDLDSFFVSYGTAHYSEGEVIKLADLGDNGLTLTQEMNGQVVNVACSGDGRERLIKVFYVGDSGDNRFPEVHGIYVVQLSTGGRWWALTPNAPAGIPVRWTGGEETKIFPICG